MADINLVLTPDMGRWLGLLISDGSINKYGRFLKFTNKEDSLREEFSELTEKIFNLNTHEINTKNRTPEIQVNSVKLIRRLNSDFQLPIGKKTKHLEIPNQIMNCQDVEILCSFIQGIFDGGAIFNQCHKIRRVDITSINPKFLSQIKYILKKLKISSRLSKTEPRLLITRKDDIRLFKELIGFKHPKRKGKLLEMTK